MVMLDRIINGQTMIITISSELLFYCNEINLEDVDTICDEDSGISLWSGNQVLHIDVQNYKYDAVEDNYYYSDGKTTIVIGFI